MVDEEVLPGWNVARNMGLAVGLHTQAGGQEHEVGRSAKDGTGRAWRGDLAAEGKIETAEAIGFGEVIEGRARDARKRFKVGGEPAVVSRDQTFEKGGTIVGIDSDQIGPDGGGAGITGDGDFAVADLKHAAEEVEHVREGAEALDRHGFFEVFGSRWIELGKAEVEAAELRVGHEELNEELVGLVFVAYFVPISWTVENRDHGGFVVVDEGAAGLERSLEIGEREAGINGQEGS